MNCFTAVLLTCWCLTRVYEKEISTLLAINCEQTDGVNVKAEAERDKYRD